MLWYLLWWKLFAFWLSRTDAGTVPWLLLKCAVGLASGPSGPQTSTQGATFESSRTSRGAPQWYKHYTTSHLIEFQLAPCCPLLKWSFLALPHATPSTSSSGSHGGYSGYSSSEALNDQLHRWRCSLLRNGGCHRLHFTAKKRSHVAIRLWHRLMRKLLLSYKNGNSTSFSRFVYPPSATKVSIAESVHILSVYIYSTSLSQIWSGDAWCCSWWCHHVPPEWKKPTYYPDSGMTYVSAATCTGKELWLFIVIHWKCLRKSQNRGRQCKQRGKCNRYPMTTMPSF